MSDLGRVTSVSTTTLFTGTREPLLGEVVLPVESVDTGPGLVDSSGDGLRRALSCADRTRGVGTTRRLEAQCPEWFHLSLAEGRLSGPGLLGSLTHDHVRNVLPYPHASGHAVFGMSWSRAPGRLSGVSVTPGGLGSPLPL